MDALFVAHGTIQKRRWVDCVVYVLVCLIVDLTIYKLIFTAFMDNFVLEVKRYPAGGKTFSLLQ